MSAKIRIECAAINPLKPLGAAVLVDGKIVATPTLEEVKDAAKRIEELERRT